MSSGKQFSLDDWAGESKLKRSMLPLIAPTVVLVLLFACIGFINSVVLKDKDSSSQYVFSRETVSKLEDKGLVSPDYANEFIHECMNRVTESGEVGNKKAGRQCECEFDSIARIAIKENKQFSQVLNELAGQNRVTDVQCEYAR